MPACDRRQTPRKKKKTYICNSFLCLVANWPPNFIVSETSISSDHPLPTLGVPKYVNISWLEFCTKS